MTPIVTVYCMAYNQSQYIRQTIEGFINQKTTFPYEIIIHDDASTDGTGEIIKEYAKRYSDIIIPIIQVENQYSKGVKILDEIVFPRIKGKYIAICEGDDYWCDPEKLQKQVDWMEEHIDYSLCAHNSRYEDCANGTFDSFNTIQQDRDFSFEEILYGGKNGRTVFHTSSILFRKEYALLPDAFLVKGMGDYPRYLYLATCGKVHCLADVMSVYRANVPGSWTYKMKTGADAQKKTVEHAHNIRVMLEKVDVATRGKYAQSIKKAINTLEYKELYIQADVKTIKRKYKNNYKQLRIIEKIKLHIRAIFPDAVNKYIAIRRK